MNANNKDVFQALGWKLLERFGVQGIQFVLQIILARLLDPDHYGTLSLMVVFTTIANVFIQRGFNTALIQNKDVTDEDYSSVFWISLLIAVGLYVVLFISAPFVADFYQMPDIVMPFRTLTLILIPGALNSVQLAKISREMDFKQVFRSNVVSILVSGVAGIMLAYCGAGLWALVVQSVLNVTFACLVMWFTVKWRPERVCNMARVKVLFSYGWKLLASGLLDTVYQNIRSLVIGKKYSTDTLGFYDRGKQFPQFLINSITGTVQSVLLPALSAEQEHKERVKQLMRNSVMLSSYIIFPMMAGLAAVANPLVRLLLTDKWLPCVPFLQIYCFTFAFDPVHTSNLQAINAMGRSDIFLKLEIVKKCVGITNLIIAVFCFDSPLAIALSGAVGTLVGCFINAFPNKKLIDYSYFDQMKDILPSFLVSIVMFFVVLLVGRLNFGPLAILVLQIFVGVIVYIAISAMVGLTPFKMLLGVIKGFLQKNR